MKLLEVIPISRGIGKETLSYFSACETVPGSIVQVPLRSRNVPALVVTVRDAAAAKSELRSLPYPIKKASRGKPSPFFLPAFIDAVSEIAGYCVATQGAVLAALIPKTLFKKETFSPPVRAEKERLFPRSGSRGSEILMLHADEEDRLAHYRARIRESFARNESLFLLLPTREDTERYHAALNKGIEPYSIVLHGSLSSTEMAHRWKHILETEHPVLIIATGSSLCIPRDDIGTYILEKENSRAYKAVARPFIDLRLVVEVLSRRMNAHLIIGGTLLRVETIARYKNNELIELAPPQFRLRTSTEQRIIDLKKMPGESKQTFSAISKKLAQHITDARAHNHRLFLFALRRGIASIITCDDCGTVVVCTNCAAPVMLQQGRPSGHSSSAMQQGNVFLCRACGAMEDALKGCSTCGSWKLTALGVGTERVEEELRSLFPEAPLFRVDSDSTHTHRQAKAVLKKFFATPGGILIGTEMALTYMHDPVEHSAIVSLDSLFAIPDFRAHEKAYDLMVRIRALTKNTLFIQTRHSEQDVLQYATNGDTNGFYRNELAIRERLRYPPFVTLIKISAEGTPASVRKNMEQLSSLFLSYAPQIFPGFTALAHGKILMHALIRIPAAHWPDIKLLEMLRSLPQNYSVNVDPESLL